MKKKNAAIIFAAVLAAAFSLTSCAGRVYYTNGNEPVSQAPVLESSTEPSVEESSEEESSEEESSEEESSEEESSEEESSEEESSEEESSEEESSEEEVEGIKITFVKPEAWSDNVYVVVYSKGDIAKLPGEAMTNNGDGTFSYIITEEIENAVAIFNDADDARHRNMYPRSGSVDVEDGKTYEPAVG